jgi:hypothetical protein
MFICQITVQVGMDRLPVYGVTQGAIWSSVCISVQKGEAADSVSIVNLMLECMLKSLMCNISRPLSLI